MARLTVPALAFLAGVSACKSQPADQHSSGKNTIRVEDIDTKRLNRMTVREKTGTTHDALVICVLGEQDRAENMAFPNAQARAKHFFGADGSAAQSVPSLFTVPTVVVDSRLELFRACSGFGFLQSSPDALRVEARQTVSELFGPGESRD